MNKTALKHDSCFLIIIFALFTVLEYFESFSIIEDQALSYLQLLRVAFGDEEDVTFSDNIVLVNTDEEFYKEYGSFPLRRADVAKITTNLGKLGARVVALDFLMEFPSSYGEDPLLVDSFSKVDNVLLVSQAQFKDDKFLRMNRPIADVRPYTHSGYTNISSASSLVESISRLEIYPEITAEEDGWPFAVQALGLYEGAEPSLEGDRLNIGDRVSVSLDHFNRVYIDYPRLPLDSTLSDIKGLSALEFLDLESLDDDELYELSLWVEDKIVLVGDTSEVSHDYFETPVGKVYGVEIIANVIDTLMKGGHLRPSPVWGEVMMNALFLTMLLMIGQIVKPGMRLVYASLLLTVYMGIVLLSYIYEGLIFSLTYTLLAGTLGFLGINLRFYLEERDQKDLIKTAFGHYLSPQVVEALVQDPSKMSLGGERREMTAFFSDVAGFSSISEKLSPEGLVHLLNDYLTHMCNIITDHQGTIDKFEGDAIIAFWGAPLDLPDHAKLACLASIDMQHRLKGLRRRWRELDQPELYVRIGLNSGPMVVGNMGSNQRMDYTMMGDAVNLASRLEGANKFYASDTMISEMTYQIVKDIVDVRPLDIIRVVGKNEPIQVYQLLDRKNQVAGSRADMVEQYCLGLEQYQRGNYERACDFFKKALSIIENDGPSLSYLARCKTFMKHPPEDDWDGVYELTSKG